MGILDQLGLTKNGELPTVNVTVEIDNKSLYKLSAAIAAALILAALVHAIINKYSK